MTMLQAATTIRLFLFLILTVQMTAAVRSGIAPECNRARHQAPPGTQVEMNEYPNSIDDEFDKCHRQMYRNITTKNSEQNLLEIELNGNYRFREAWNNAKIELHLGNKENYKLSHEQLRKIALHAYTRDEIYQELNRKMRTGKGTYKTDFGLISLHFLITDGIKNLQSHRREECITTYRTMDDAVSISSPFVRFGSFGSSSRSASVKFGTKTCFIIKTCHGADISQFSAVPEEEEVLIPPYERFQSRVLDIRMEHIIRIPPIFHQCHRVYKLDSKDTMSNMKCELIGEKENKILAFLKKMKTLFGQKKPLVA
ncbi:hypothetical protein SRHO_G00076890 [Serrasalmus rhombeus]